MPSHIIAWPDGRDVDHRGLQVKVGMQSIVQFLAVRWNSTLEDGRVLFFHLPVIRVEEGRAMDFGEGAPGPEEGSQQEVSSGSGKQRVHHQCALAWIRLAHRQPTLEHPEHGAGSRTVIQVEYHR